MDIVDNVLQRTLELESMLLKVYRFKGIRNEVYYARDIKIMKLDFSCQK